ncbi:MAG: Na+/H+ antiporter NhaC family protein [Anaerovoracaceae bacterium]|jgi:NhaC family Na+:H+ antiporter
MPAGAAFIIFLASMLVCIATGHTMLIALAVGFVCFFAAACRLDRSPGEVLRMAWLGIRTSLVVVVILMLVGCITGLWRSAGVIAYFVYYGMKIITPHLFILIAFLLAVVLSYALGTSFGVAATAGVIFVTLAKSGNVSLLITGGAILSGCYFGDRGSPVSSSAAITANVTGTDMNGNVREMMRSAVLPLALCIAVYGILSYLNPVTDVDPAIMKMLSSDFVLTPWLLLPAAVVIILPLFKVNINIVMASSIVIGFVETMVIQGAGFSQTMQYMITGFTAEDPVMGAIMNGGGLTSMLEICAILAISCSYSVILKSTGMLRGAQRIIVRIAARAGRFAATLITGITMSALFCNQTIATVMTVDLVERMYHLGGAPKRELAIDIENSAIVMAAAIPWCLAAAVVYQVMGLGSGILLYSYYPVLVSVCWLFTKNRIGIKDKG